MTEERDEFQRGDGLSTPNPGSREAVERGCLCAEIDNAYGRGYWSTYGSEPLFWITATCPLHGAVAVANAREVTA